jgi:dihydrofolate reductase
LDRAVPDPRWAGRHARRVRRALQFAARPSHVRYLVGILAQGAKLSDGDGLNAATKYVATNRPESLAWGPFEGVGPDFVEGLRRLKSQDGPDLVLSGSSTLTSILLEQGLADEVLLAVYPVLLGTGKRFFADGTPARAFALASTRAFPSGIIFNTYTVAGPLKTE